ncbi:MAG: divergent polysaccharide deacetylase family protein [Alphaproteobacteria bacterium]|nr:divergent polysaccharide deacetylase family protein [Alphaproteobacteria bacterium]
MLLVIGIFLGLQVASWFAKVDTSAIPVPVSSSVPGAALSPTPVPPSSQPVPDKPAEKPPTPVAPLPQAAPLVKPVPIPPPAAQASLKVPPEHGPYTATPIPDARIWAPAPSKDGSPPWLAHAVPFKDIPGRPVVAVVIDDLGLDRRRPGRILDLPGPITLSFLSYAQELAQQTSAGLAKGHELLVHVPMEPVAASYDPGPESDLLKVGLAPEEIRRRLERDLGQFTGYVGFNNHMGSRFTADRAGMRVVLEEVKARGLLFLDSRTSAQSVGAEVARDLGIPFAERNVFLDNDPSRPAVEAQLAKLEDYARQYGHAIAIGHPHDGTIEALGAWLSTLEAKGIALVPVSAIVKRQAKSTQKQ